MIVSSTIVPTVSFDARPCIAQGEEPLTDILELAATLTDGDVLEVLAPFDPLPLYEVLHARGFRTPTCGAAQEPDTWRARFTRVAISPTHTVASVQSRHPTTISVLAEFGLDACCGGAHTLEFASLAHGVDMTELLTRLEAAALGSGRADTK